MQKKILFVGIKPEELQQLFPVSAKSNTDILLRPSFADALPILSTDNEVHLIFTKVEYVRQSKTLPSSSNGGLQRTASQSDSSPPDLPNLIGQSEGIREIYARIGKVAATDSTVLIEGESGTGKELVAQAIHFHSYRNHRPFVKVNCATLPDNLIESELFGHVKGAFTGATVDRKGRFARAEGGTILLDEIGSMPLASQAKFLRVLQEKEFEPVGSSRTIKADVRVIATDNSNLAKSVESGTFREDLYYRLSVFPIMVPPLRLRRQDLPLLCNYFIHKYADLNPGVDSLSQEALQIVMRFDWPGNVRQLENAIQHALIVERTEAIQASSLPEGLIPVRWPASKPSQSLHLRDQLNSYEKQLIEQALAQSNGRKSVAAELMGIHPKNLGRLLQKHGLVEVIKSPIFVINLLPASIIQFSLDLSNFSVFC